MAFTNLFAARSGCVPCDFTSLHRTPHCCRSCCHLLLLQAFLKYAIEAQCPLTFPFPGDNVVVLRAGLLRRIDRWALGCGFARGWVYWGQKGGRQGG